MKAIQDFWKGLTSAQKLVVAVVLLVLAWYAYNVVKARMDATKADIKGKSEISVLQSSGQKATYGNDTYEKFATVLFNSMDGPGTSTALVLKTFSYLNNDIDFIKLYTAFGVREASDNMFGLIASSDLSGWVRDDLSESDVSMINKQFAMKGMKKRL